MIRTYKNIEVEAASIENNWRVGGNWPMLGHSSNGYHGIFKTWFHIYGLKGDGYLIGENLADIRPYFQAIDNDVGMIKTIDLTNADIIWDITTPPRLDIQSVDWVVCQAVIEHLIDPISAIRHLIAVLKEGGRLYIHSHGPAYKYHAFPIDCYRFFPDALIGLATYLDAILEDMLWTEYNCFVVYRKKHE